MKTEEFSLIADDGKSIHTYRWSPDGAVKACILLAHGLAEHAGRYARVAASLTAAGYELWAPDHRGHGKTAAEGELGWLAPKDGFRRVVSDMHCLADRIHADRPGVKLFLFGHSWGSFLSQGFISLYGNELAGCILSGTALNRGPLLAVGGFLAKIGCLFKGEKRQSPLLNSMSFGSFNNAFKPNRTEFDWLSTDTAEVDKYIADPYCGFVGTFGLFRDLLAGLQWTGQPATIKSVPVKLPLYLFAGEKDPVGAATGAFASLALAYQDHGCSDLTVKLYPGCRHEMLNETIRDEVAKDLLSWLEAH